MDMSTENIIHLLWAKSDRKDPRLYHPILYHCIDVANVANLLLSDCLYKVMCSALMQDIGTDNQAVVAFIAGLHDIGKASPVFQKIITELAAKLDGSELDIGSAHVKKPHGTITAHELRTILLHGKASVCASRDTADILAKIAGAHHGVFAQSEIIRNLAVDSLGDSNWSDARLTLAASLWRLLNNGKEVPTKLQSDELTNHTIVPILAGLISVADWIGSNTDYFPFDSESDPKTYFKKSKKEAQKALNKIGWLPVPVYADPKPFDKVFPFAPNNMQQLVARIANRQAGPFLLAIEAQMGEGKTEAALYAADSALCAGRARGLYIALPTQATSNAMFDRIKKDYLEKRGHVGIKDNFQLVHGNSLLVEMARISSVGDEAANDDEALSAKTWFTARKRPLLAPFGVGTIDQALLSVLQTKHWFVRLFGLAGKVVVFDEVHAYDTYTGTLLDQLIEWLSALDCTVVLLSATLPHGRLNELVSAYSSRQLGECAEYPRITLANRSECACTHVEGKYEPKQISVEFKSDAPAEVAKMVLDRLSDGGCAAVICNKVDRAQHIFEAIKSMLETKQYDCEVILFHARTPFGWRKETEEDVLSKFGKPDKDGVSPDRPHRAVVIATQVIEQSLDLDFDWIITDMAPIDLILQRLGREHRHKRPPRPAAVSSPVLTILSDGQIGGPPPEFATSGIYERYILLRSWLAISTRHSIILPDDIDPLVQWVYGDEEPKGLDAGWMEALKTSHEDFICCKEVALKAKSLLVSKPDYPEDIISKFNKQLGEDDDPNVHESVKAATRDGKPSIQVVCLRREGDALYPVCGTKPVDLDVEPDKKLIGELLASSLSIQRPALFCFLKKQPPPKGWKKNPHLRYYRALEFIDDKSQVGSYYLELNRELGLVIGKEES